MHPAFSVLFFTTMSGAGYGLLFLCGIMAPLHLLPDTQWFAFCAMALALGMISLGLLSSTFHLGHPERAWRAFSQWRSSWLSREGVAAVATFLPAGLFGIGWVFLGQTGGLWALTGVLAAAGAAVTVICTGMIYACLQTIRQWHHPLTVPVYLALALASGSLWGLFLLAAFGATTSLMAVVALLSVAGSGILKWRYWQSIDQGHGDSTVGSALGLGVGTKARLLDAPHTEENYLIKEMGYRVGRKHRDKLRRLAMLLGFLAPIFLVLLTFVTGGFLAALGAFLAAALGLVGVFIERWLFFAEATHKVTLYYGAQAA